MKSYFYYFVFYLLNFRFLNFFTSLAAVTKACLTLMCRHKWFYSLTVSITENTAALGCLCVFLPGNEQWGSQPSQAKSSPNFDFDLWRPGLCFMAACQSCISGYHALKVVLAVSRYKMRPKGIPDVTPWVQFHSNSLCFQRLWLYGTDTKTIHELHEWRCAPPSQICEELQNGERGRDQWWSERPGEKA